MRQHLPLRLLQTLVVRLWLKICGSGPVAVSLVSGLSLREVCAETVEGFSSVHFTGLQEMSGQT